MISDFVVWIKTKKITLNDEMIRCIVATMMTTKIKRKFQALVLAFYPLKFSGFHNNIGIICSILTTNANPKICLDGIAEISFLQNF